MSALGMAIALGIGTIGADGRWPIALGRFLVQHRSVPDFVPFAAAPSADWANVPVLAELALWAANAGGDRGLALLNALAVGVALLLLARDARRHEAAAPATGVVLLLVVAASLQVVVAMRLQLFSLVLFPLLVGLLRAQARTPSRRIWLAPLLVCVWSNLHGAVLVGIAVLGAYLVVERFRREPAVATGVLVASLLAANVTPALWRTPAYFAGIMSSEAARTGYGLWQPLSLRSPLDLLLVTAAGTLVVLMLRAHPRTWELVAVAGLAVLTVRTERSGVWLAFFAAAPAARALVVRERAGSRLLAAGVGVAVTLSAFGIVRGPVETGASARLVKAAIARAHGRPILAPAIAAEEIAVARGRVWIANPLDAFSQADQRRYIAWLEGEPGGDAALERAGGVVLVEEGSDAAARLQESRRYVRVAADGRVLLYLRRSG